MTDFCQTYKSLFIYPYGIKIEILHGRRPSEIRLQDFRMWDNWQWKNGLPFYDTENSIDLRKASRIRKKR